MNGSLLPTAGEPCPAVVPAPYSLGEDIMANSVCCACFRNPPHQRHTPRLLEGQAPEARALHMNTASLFCVRDKGLLLLHPSRSSRASRRA